MEFGTVMNVAKQSTYPNNERIRDNQRKLKINQLNFEKDLPKIYFIFFINCTQFTTIVFYETILREKNETF